MALDAVTSPSKLTMTINVHTKEKTQQLRQSLEPEKFTCKLEKFITVYQGYSKLKPKIFPKRMSAMFPSDVVVASDGQPQNFRPAFGSSASLKRHQQDWSDKYQRTRPGYAIASPIAAARDRDDTDHGRLKIVGAPDGQMDKRKPYGSIGRARKSHTKSPRRVVLRASGDSSTGKNLDHSSDILCSSVFLTYREGLFFNTKQPTARETNCTDV
uniref:Uncharacterized protein n=1 Tax=Anopheles culicifacies TaxID=139723 RepID=A0A182MJE7_9DIPT